MVGLLLLVMDLFLFIYRTSGNIGDELIVAVWWLGLEPPN